MSTRSTGKGQQSPISPSRRCGRSLAGGLSATRRAAPHAATLRRNQAISSRARGVRRIRLVEPPCFAHGPMPARGQRYRALRWAVTERSRSAFPRRRPHAATSRCGSSNGRPQSAKHASRHHVAQASLAGGVYPRGRDSFSSFGSGYCFAMPKVDPETNEPMSDAPDQDSADVRGGKGREEMPTGANPTGSGGPMQQGHTTSEPKQTSPGSTDAGSAD